MRTVVPALALLLVAASLAGCADVAPPPVPVVRAGPAEAATPTAAPAAPAQAAPRGAPTTSAQPSPTSTAPSPPPHDAAPAPGPSGGNATDAPADPDAAPPNHAPLIRSFQPVHAEGTAPFVAEFAINATDEDGDALSYTIQWGDASSDGGGALPTGNVTHTYYVARNYTALLTVSDFSSSVEATARIAVREAPPEGTPSAGGTSLVAAPCPLCYLDRTPTGQAGWQGCLGLQAGRNAVDCLFFPLGATLAGHGFAASVAPQQTDTATFQDVGVWFLSACSPGASTIAHWDQYGIRLTPDDPQHLIPHLMGGIRSEWGSVPGGAGCALVYSSVRAAQQLCFQVDADC
jgi:hypothetical protein